MKWSNIESVENQNKFDKEFLELEKSFEKTKEVNKLNNNDLDPNDDEDQINEELQTSSR